MELQSEADHSQETHANIDEIGERLAFIMGLSPFNAHTSSKFSYENGEMVGRVELKPELIGNPNFQILHGGMTATILDTIGGLVGMFEIYKRNQGTFEEQTKKVKRLATVDLRIDYLAPGRGKEFIATAEILRMGRKGCTSRMLLVNDEGKKIAHGIASYAF
ncbi:MULTISPECIES: thioesterase family protein [unclassified Moraxella]|uniref:thioesterase family protein n=1 Tax=unclassified Moraxella TaxID=2685852 RepID=UPI003AF8AA2A